MENYDKLVRDNIPEILDKKGVKYEQRVASLEEYRFELVRKLEEEVREFLSSDGSPEELADVIEVIEALKLLPEYQLVEKIRQDKKNERGGFEKRLILKGQKD